MQHPSRRCGRASELVSSASAAQRDQSVDTVLFNYIHTGSYSSGPEKSNKKKLLVLEKGLAAQKSSQEEPGLGRDDYIRKDLERNQRRVA